MTRAKAPLTAVYDDQLVELLDSLGLRGKFESGQIRCAFSGDVIGWDNLHSLFPDSGQIKAVCSKPECIKALLAKRDERLG